MMACLLLNNVNILDLALPPVRRIDTPRQDPGTRCRISRQPLTGKLLFPEPNDHATDDTQSPAIIKRSCKQTFSRSKVVEGAEHEGKHTVATWAINLYGSKVI